MSDFKGVWIPAVLWQCKKTSLIEKLFLTQIYSLEMCGGCNAGNAYFSAFFDVTKSRCSQVLKSLETKKMIEITIKRDGKMITERVCKLLTLGMYYFKFGYVENYTPYVENAKENNEDKKKEDSLFDKRLNLQLPFDVVSTSQTINATYKKPFLELKEDLKNIFGIEPTDSDIETAIKTFATVAVGSYDKYQSIRQYEKLCNLFKEWIPKSIKFEGSKPKAQPLQLEPYLLQHYREKDVLHFKEKGDFSKWETTLTENLFKLTNIAKGYKNENLSPLFFFEIMYMPFSLHLNGSKPERKLESFEKIFEKETDYNKEKGDFRKIIKANYEKIKA